MEYDPDLTFDANANRLDASKSLFRASDISNALRDAYADGWQDARACQLAGVQIPECPAKD